MFLSKCKSFTQLLWRFLCFVFKSFIRNKGLDSAKSLTYTSLFAVVPLITLIVAMLAIIPSFQDFGVEVQSMIFDRLLPSSSSEIEVYLSDFASQAKKVTWVGAIMFMVTAYLMLMNVERSFNHIWGVQELRKGLSSFLLYWSVLSLGPLLLGVGLGVSSYIASLKMFEIFTEVSDSIGASNFLLGLFPEVLTIGAFTLLYVAVPNCGVRFRDGLIGGVVVALSFLIVKKAFTLVISMASYELLYGTFAAVPIFLIWIYIGWVVILFGANLVKALPLFNAHFGSQQVHPSIIMLALLHKFWEKQQSGESLRISELMKEKWPSKSVEIEELLRILVREKIILRNNQEEYLLIRDLQSLSLWNILRRLPWPLPASKELDILLPDVLARHIRDYKELQGRFNKVEELSEREFAEPLGQFYRDVEIK